MVEVTLDVEDFPDPEKLLTPPADTPEIHPAIELLLARMDSHPEEFTERSRWTAHYEQYKRHWTQHEKKLFANKHREIQMREMHEKMLKRMVDGEDNLTKAANERARVMQQLAQAQAQRTPIYSQLFPDPTANPYLNQSNLYPQNSILGTTAQTGQLSVNNGTSCL